MESQNDIEARHHDSCAVELKNIQDRLKLQEMQLVDYLMY